MRANARLEGTFDGGAFDVSSLSVTKLWPGEADFLMRLHGDEGPFFRGHNLMVLNISTPFCTGDPLAQHLQNDNSAH